MINNITAHLEEMESASSTEEKIACAQRAIEEIGGFTTAREKKVAILRLADKLPNLPPFLPLYREVSALIDTIDDAEDRRSAHIEIARDIPSDGAFLSLYGEVVGKALDAAGTIGDPKHRKSAVLRLANGIPKSPETEPLFLRAMSDAVETAAQIDDRFIRSYALVDIADELPMIADFIPLRLHALRLSIGVEGGPGYKKYSLQDIAKELPQTCDYAFYRKYTLLGIAKDLPHKAEFFDLFKEAIHLAIEAVEYIEEPYYQKYALIFIAKALPKTDEFHPLFMQVMTHAYEVTTKITDPFVQNYALIDLLQVIPKSEEFFPLLAVMIEQILSFFTIKKRMEDVELVDVIDYIIVAEERKIKDSTKKKFTRTKYALMIAKELNKFGEELNDIRLIEIMKPYTHRWIQPKELRDAVSRIVTNLAKLRGKYHGCEIGKPLLVSHTHLAGSEGETLQERDAAKEDCISIDLGATNTVVARKKRGDLPATISLSSISKTYGNVHVIPTRLDPKTGMIGMEATGEGVVVNFKKILLEGQKEGTTYMESYVNALYDHLKREIALPQWYSFLTSSRIDRLYVTVPVGFHDYRKSIRKIVEKVKRGMEVVFLEEPLAAAIGYQVAEVSDKIVLIIDFGGSTLDLMMVRLNVKGVHVVSKPDRSKVLGGHDIDAWLAEYIEAKMTGSAENQRRTLLDKAEEIKIALSERSAVPCVWAGQEICTITRDIFEEILVEHDFYKTIDKALVNIMGRAKKIGVTSEMIEAILLTGGSSQIPSFKEKIGDLFPTLRKDNAIYDHSPLSAVATGAALYGTRDVIDRHLGLAYALRYHTGDQEAPHGHEVLFEKGESFPFSKSYTLTPAKTLGDQDQLYIEFFEIPERHIVRRWVKESGEEVIKQIVKIADDTALRAFKIVTLSFGEPVAAHIEVTFCVDKEGHLTIKYNNNITLDTSIRLQ
ncbi:MAG: Hsp70 family protein [Thermodesulfobacteriota bacterium]